MLGTRLQKYLLEYFAIRNDDCYRRRLANILLSESENLWRNISLGTHTRNNNLELYALRAIKGSMVPPGYKPFLGSETYQTNCSRAAWGGGGGFQGRGDLSALRPAIAASVSSHVMQSLLSVMSVLCAFSHVRHVSFAHFSLGRFGAMHVFSFISSFSVLIVLHGGFPMICFGRVFSFQLFCFWKPFMSHGWLQRSMIWKAVRTMILYAIHCGSIGRGC